MSKTRTPRSCLGFVLLVAVAMTALASQARAALGPEDQSTADDPVYREIMLVFDPRLGPPHASDIVNGRANDVASQAFVNVLGKPESLRQWFASPFLADAQVQALRAGNPLAPELLVPEVIVIRYPIGADMNAELQRIKTDSRVLNAVRNFRMDFSVTPADTFFQVNVSGNPNGFPVTPTFQVQGKYQWGSAFLRFPQAWDKLRGDAYLADLNTGVYWQGGATLPDLQANLRPHFSAWMKNMPSSPLSWRPDPNFDETQLGGTNFGHGTHVAGIIAATPNNLTGVAGGCWSCSFFEIGVGGETGSSSAADQVGAAMMQAITRGAQAINMSFGVGPDALNRNNIYVPNTFCATNPNVPPCNVIAIAATRDVVLVAASGNDSYHVQFPANQPNVMAIGGLMYTGPGPTADFWNIGYNSTYPGDPLLPGPVTLPLDCMATTQGWGQTGSNCGVEQFLVAPAKDVVSTFYPGKSWYPTGRCEDLDQPEKQGDAGWSAYLTPGYGDCTGTSMAAPFVTATVGLMRSANPLLLVADIRRLLQKNASGNDSRIDNYKAYGWPLVDNSVISVLSGASASNPNLFDPTVKNRLTPLFSLYSPEARNHFYSIAPQMAVVAVNGTLIPSPKLKVNATSYSATCPGNNSSCPNDLLTASPSSITPSITVLKPNGSPVNTAGYAVRVDYSSGTIVSPSSSLAATDSNGVVAPGMKWPDFPVLPTYSTTLTATPSDSYLLVYSIVGNLIPNYNLFPSLTNFGQNPRSSASVYVSHVNPLGSGPDLVPLYRMSWRCGDSANTICDTGINNFHISHVYTTDPTEKQSLLSAGYKFDGIEGYVFPTSYSSAPQSGMVKLCRLYDPVADELILFPGMGTNGKNCYPPFPSYASSSYYSANRFSTNWLGWVYPNYSGGTPPTVSVTSPTNGQQFNVGASVTLKASASGNVQSVSYYANGAFIGTKTSSPYQKNWTVNAAGTYIIYAVASQTSTGLTTTSAPITITVGTAPPTVANNGFETPVVGNGNYQWAPTGASWTFDPSSPTGGSGISGNGSAFTNANPNAPEGVQVAFIQGAHAISQAINFTATGTYHVQFYAAQRGGNGSLLQLQLLVDGVNVGTQYPGLGSTSYSSYPSNSFGITSTGSHTITFLGVNNDGLDNSMFFDLVTIASP